MEYSLIVRGLNIQLFESINGLSRHNQLLDRTMIFLANDAIWIIPVLLVYLWSQKSRGGRINSLFIFASILLSWGGAAVISAIYFIPRPFMAGLGKALIHHPSDSSFPSDHTTVLAAASFTLFYLGSRKTGALFLFLALLVGFARIYCGIHFPLDIIGGLCVATLGSSIAFMLKDKPAVIFGMAIRVYAKAKGIVCRQTK